jgi:hypothetical protein
MKAEDIQLLKLPNKEAAQKLIDIDDAHENLTGESILGETKPFLLEVIKDTEDSIIPNAFSSLLNARLTGKLRAMPGNQK